MQQIFTAYIEKDEDTGYYIGIVPSVPGAYTQAKTLDELNVCLQEVLELCSASLSEDEKKDIPKFIGIHQIAIAV